VSIYVRLFDAEGCYITHIQRATLEDEILWRPPPKLELNLFSSMCPKEIDRPVWHFKLKIWHRAPGSMRPIAADYWRAEGDERAESDHQQEVQDGG
jgi:hypothetical protein